MILINDLPLDRLGGRLDGGIKKLRHHIQGIPRNTARRIVTPGNLVNGYAFILASKIEGRMIFYRPQIGFDRIDMLFYLTARK